MPAHPIPNPVLDPNPIVFELILDRERTRFELDANEDRAFVVGASAHADLRVNRARVPPIAFYVERRQNEAWLVPGYRRGNLRLDGTIVIAGCRLGRRARIEFAGVLVELEAVMPSGAGLRPIFDEDLPTELSESTRQSSLEYLRSLPDMDDRTLIDPEPKSRTRSDTERVRCPPAAVLCRSQPARLPNLEAPAPPGKPPHLWAVLAERPYETVALVLLVAAVMGAAAIAAAIVLRLAAAAH